MTVTGPISLFSIGHYQAGFCQDGHAAQWLGDWSGSDPVTGASYQPNLQELGRRAARIHVPWRGGAGDFHLEYRLIDAAKKAGYLFALHENYIDFYPNAASFNPEDIALDGSGKWQTAWLNKGLNVQLGNQL